MAELEAELDIHVELHVFQDARWDMTRDLRGLEALAAGLQRNMSRAAERYDNRNFTEACACVRRMQGRLSLLREGVEGLQRYLEKLEACAEEYLRSGFRKDG